MDTQERTIKDVIAAHFPTESALARALNWDRRRLNKITTGYRLPTIDELNDIAHALGEPVDMLMQIFLRQKSPNGQHIGT